ncbi:unnamed protein product [Cuscuta campestris]|uniref:Retrotransposon gag domain-containing protein n=1 Tax=Cuscuta campestris TaxID=132261 RepID=A0A484NJ69_9ASTE|nr:unnamed protein product [Cuscuta campestris]
MPFVKRYDGESDPQEHINSYVQVMIAIDASDALMCRCFLQTVDSKVADWVNHIPAGSIRTWDELGLRFLEHFAWELPTQEAFHSPGFSMAEAQRILEEFPNTVEERVHGG